MATIQKSLGYVVTQYTRVICPDATTTKATIEAASTGKFFAAVPFREEGKRKTLVIIKA